MISEVESETRIMHTDRPNYVKVFELLFREESSGVNPSVLIEHGLKLPWSCKILRIRLGLKR